MHKEEQLLSDLVSEDSSEELLQDKFDVEALAQLVEQISYSRELSGKLEHAFKDVRGQLRAEQVSLGSTQKEIRDLIIDVELLKRAIVSLGQIGVMARRKIERELILELFPPDRPRKGAGVSVAPPSASRPKKVDCENRLHLCKAACCRIFSVSLNAKEIAGEQFDWDEKNPYVLRRESTGCVHLKKGTCACTVYADRPKVCENYSCENDRRIWADFEKKIINPELKKRLDLLSVVTHTGDIYGNTDRFASTPQKDRLRELKEPLSEDSSPAVVTALQINENRTDSISGSAGEVNADPTVCPPNFDELRKMLVPQPERRFVPTSGAVRHTNDSSS